jgi:hypothetical protein
MPLIKALLSCYERTPNGGISEERSSNGPADKEAENGLSQEVRKDREEQEVTTDAYYRLQEDEHRREEEKREVIATAKRMAV